MQNMFMSVLPGGGTPEVAAFVLGADFILTDSINMQKKERGKFEKFVYTMTENLGDVILQRLEMGRLRRKSTGC